MADFGTDRRYSLYNANGTLTQQVVQNRAGTRLSTTNTYQNSIVRMEGYREGITSASSTYFQTGSTTNTYDKNGFLTQVTDARAPANNRSLVNNASGQILAKMQNGLTQRTALFAGQQLAIYGR